MKRTIEAVKYGIETLGISPNALFDLIKSSNGYDGDDYNRWLANEIIKIAEKDGVGYSQLLVKKFSIISSILDGVDVSIKKEWLDFFSSMLGVDSGSVMSINFDGIGTKFEEDVDWYSDVDLMSEKFFSEGNLPENLMSNLRGDSEENFAIVAKLESDSCSKNSELFKSAKSVGVVCKNKGSMLLYRMCNLAEAWDLGVNFKFGFFVSTSFLSDEDNADIIKLFLRYYNYTGVAVNSVNLFDETYLDSKYLFIVCTPSEEVYGNDGFVLKDGTIKDSKVCLFGTSKRYSRSSVSMLKYLRENQWSGHVLGYLTVPTGREHCCVVSNEQSKDSIAITETNLKYVVVYFSVVRSLSKSGLSSDINIIMDGHSEFSSLFYNCLPLFLFDVNSKFKKEGGSTNYFDIETSKFIQSLVSKGEVYYSYESKELLGICKGFIDYVRREDNSVNDELSFEEIRKEANHEDLNEQYLSALVNIKDYIKSLYNKFK